MCMNKKLHILSFSLGGVFFILDQSIKYYFFHHPNFSWYLTQNFLGLEYFENFGIAFGIPLPPWLTLVGTVIFLPLLVVFVSKKQHPLAKYALSLIVWGALSNFVDRIFFHFTIDYIRIFTSILNIADIMIVLGSLLLLLGEKNKKPLV